MPSPGLPAPGGIHGKLYETIGGNWPPMKFAIEGENDMEPSPPIVPPFPAGPPPTIGRRPGANAVRVCWFL